MLDVSPMGPGFFIFFHEPEDTTRGGGQGAAKRKADYYAKAKCLIEKEREEKLKEKEKLEKQIEILEIRIKPDTKISIRKEIELELAQVSKSLLLIEKDLAEIKQTRKAIQKRARIMRSNDTLILLIGEGCL